MEFPPSRLRDFPASLGECVDQTVRFVAKGSNGNILTGSSPKAVFLYRNYVPLSQGFERIAQFN